MITAPYPIAPQLGPLAAPVEEELVAAYPELRDHALTLPWAAEVLGLQPARLVALARAGELVVVPGPWPMRQAHASDLGYLLPAWQFVHGQRPHPDIPPLIAAAADRGWTSLELHRFMTTPPADGEAAPADLLHTGEIARVMALLPGEHDTQRRAPAAVHRQRRSVERRRRPARRGTRAGAAR
jgi:hypothetical protein